VSPPRIGNAGYPWDEFDPDWYVQHNYSELRDDDRRILELVRDHFHRSFRHTSSPAARGIDVGSGANLYPPLAMLPFCREVTLWERGANNVRWLNDEVQFFSPLWNDYWDVLSVRDGYREIEEPRHVLRARARVRMADLFRLPVRAWDMGTLFFVAEGVSDQEWEFKAAIERFIGSLKPGAPFAAAFMHDSSGYYVDRLRFPAVAVSEADVEYSLTPLVDDLEITPVLSGQMLRSGYRGMIVAVGKAGRARA
jgi:hypothetical protein